MHIVLNYLLQMKGCTMAGIIPFLRTSKMKDLELVSVLSLIIKLLEDVGYTSDIFIKLIAELKKLLAQYQQTINRQRKSKLTAHIRHTDELRNRLLDTLWKAVAYFLTMEGTPMGSAAELIQNVIDTYGKGITRESDKVETVTIRSLLRDLSGADEVAALETLSLTATVNELQETNETFDELYLQRAADEAEDTTPTLISMRKRVAERCYLLVYLVNFYSSIEPETFSALAGELAEIIGDAMSVAKARETRNSHEDETPEEDETPAEEFIVSDE